jgi:hypothetical protein
MWGYFVQLPNEVNVTFLYCGATTQNTHLQIFLYINEVVLHLVSCLLVMIVNKNYLSAKGLSVRTRPLRPEVDRSVSLQRRANEMANIQSSFTWLIT